MTLPGALPFFGGTMHLLVVAVFLCAGVVKGVVGLGLPTISMALLALVMAPAEAAALLIVPSLLTNVWQVRPWRSLGPLLRRLAPMQVGVGIGTLAGSWIFGAPAGAWAVVSLGAALIGYALWGFARARLSIRRSTERWLGPAIGAVTGLVTAATGVFVVPAVPYLQSLGLDRDETIRAMGIWFTVSTVALGAGLALNGRYPGATLAASAVLLLPALAGMALGQRLRSALSPTLFRHCFFGSLILLGVHMIANQLLVR